MAGERRATKSSPGSGPSQSAGPPGGRPSPGANARQSREGPREPLYLPGRTMACRWGCPLGAGEEAGQGGPLARTPPVTLQSRQELHCHFAGLPVPVYPPLSVSFCLPVSLYLWSLSGSGSLSPSSEPCSFSGLQACFHLSQIP